MDTHGFGEHEFEGGVAPAARPTSRRCIRRRPGNLGRGATSVPGIAAACVVAVLVGAGLVACGRQPAAETEPAEPVTERSLKEDVMERATALAGVPGGDATLAAERGDPGSVPSRVGTEIGGSDGGAEEGPDDEARSQGALQGDAPSEADAPEDSQDAQALSVARALFSSVVTKSDPEWQEVEVVRTTTGRFAAIRDLPPRPEGAYGGDGVLWIVVFDTPELVLVERFLPENIDELGDIQPGTTLNGPDGIFTGYYVLAPAVDGSGRPTFTAVGKGAITPSTEWHRSDLADLAITGVSRGQPTGEGAAP